MAKRNQNSRNAAGPGTIRKKTVIRNGKEYVFWEARYTEGYDPGTGKQIQRSISGKTQREVVQKLKAATAAIDAGTYTAPSKMTVGDWLDIWTTDYLGGVKPFTVASYKGHVKNHIKPAMGAIKLEALSPHTIQEFYNKLGQTNGDKPGLSPKTIKDIHGIFHKALQQAVAAGYIRSNPADACILPRVERKQLNPMDESQIQAFLEAIRGHRYEALFTVTLFTGMQQGEVLGLMWDCVDFDRGIILIDKQLHLEKKRGGQYVFASLKNDKARTIAPASWVMQLLKRHRTAQLKQRLLAGPLWEDNGLVFTDDIGRHLATQTVYKDFKKIVSSIGCPNTRFHDLRHSYAVAAIRSGDDIKTIQGNLGHATAAFTLDIYGHVTDQMKQASAARMDTFIKDVLNL